MLHAFIFNFYHSVNTRYQKLYTIGKLKNLAKLFFTCFFQISLRSKGNIIYFGDFTYTYNKTTEFF